MLQVLRGTFISLRHSSGSCKLLLFHTDAGCMMPGAPGSQARCCLESAKGASTLQFVYSEFGFPDLASILVGGWILDILV